MKDYRFPEVLKALLKENKMTRRDLSHKTSCSNNAICNWCRGDFTPSVYALMELSELFDVSIDYLICGEEHKNNKVGGIWGNLK